MSIINLLRKIWQRLTNRADLELPGVLGFQNSCQVTLEKKIAFKKVLVLVVKLKVASIDSIHQAVGTKRKIRQVRKVKIPSGN